MECAADGKYITLENTSKRTEELGGWRITRVIDGNEFADFTLPKDYKLNGGSKSKIWARGAAPYQRSQYDIEANIQSFGVGGNIVTKLLSASGEEKASHVQKTLYSS
jgi:intermediate filament protein if